MTSTSQRAPSPSVAVSVVIPVYNEVESIPALCAELVGVLETLNCSFEVIFVDDGSIDGTFEVLRRLHASDPRLRIIRLRRNYGQTPAISAGFDASRGEWVVTMDADRQNDPADIPRMLDKAREGFDVVSGWRVRRQDALVTRRIPSRVANWLIGRVMGLRLHDFGCALKVYHHEVVRNVNLYGELHRFLPAVAREFGVTVAEVPVGHRPREHGRSKYAGMARTLTRATKVLLDLVSVRFLLSYSTRPIHIFGTVGLLTSGTGLALALYLAWLKLVEGEALAGRPLLILAVTLIIVGVQFVSVGLLGDLVVRTYHESQGKPIYSIREELAAPR